MQFKYFNPETDPLMVGVNDQVMMMLDSAHQVASQILPTVKFVITSGKRTADENSVLRGAVPDSAHLTGLAVDLLVPGNAEFAAMMIGLAEAGFVRYGFYYVMNTDPDNFTPRHIHVDCDEAKPYPCIFTKRELN